MSPAVTIFNRYPLEFHGGGEVSLTSVARFLNVSGIDVRYVSDSSYAGLTRVVSDVPAPSLYSFKYERERFCQGGLLGASSLFRPLPFPEQFRASSVNLVAIDRVPPPDYLLKLAKTRVRVVFLLHGISLEPILPPNPMAAAYLLYLRRAFSAFRLVAENPYVCFQVFNEWMASELARLGIPSDRVFIIPSGPDLRLFSAPVQSPLFEILVLTRMERATKGLDFLCAVLRRLMLNPPDRLRVQICGSGKDSEIVHRLTRFGQVEYLGFVDEAHKLGLLRSANVVLVTSFIEPFSMSTVEALVSGAEVYSTPVSGPSAIISSDTIFGRVFPYDVASFVKALTDEFVRWERSGDGLVTERALRQERAMRLFSADSMGQGYLAMIQRLEERNQSSESSAAD